MSGIFTPKECECPLEHSITKLGHCRDCSHHGTASDTQMVPQVECLPGCPPRHADSTPHDFDFATYADDRVSYGVCRCGHNDMSQAFWEGM